MRNASSAPRATPAGLLPALMLALVLGLSAGPAWSQYKWKDSRGQVHVSDLPPPRDIPDKDVLQRPATAPRPATPTPAASAAASAASAAGAALPPKPMVDPELEARRKQAEQDAKAKAQADAAKLAAQRADNCRRAREQMATLETGQRLVQVNPQGERVVMDDAARASAAEQLRKAIAADCR